MDYAAHDRLADCEELRIGVGVPAPLSGRLDQLVEVADAAGSRTNRKELLAALILDAPESEEELAALVGRFRLARVRNAFVGRKGQAPILRPAAPSRGPRPRRRTKGT